MEIEDRTAGEDLGELDDTAGGEAAAADSGEGEPGEAAPAEGELEDEEAAGAPADESLVPLAAGDLRAAVEAVLFSLSEPVAIRALAELFKAPLHDVRAAVEELREEYVASGRAFRIEDIAGGVQILTLSKFDPWVRLLRHKQREGRLSPAALETLAVIAYKQPITKADLEGIRGVGCGPILKTLLDRGFIGITGRAEALGRPLLYGTTRRFLESFGLRSVRDLPQPELEAKLAAEAGPPPRALPADGAAAEGLETTVGEGPGAN